MTRGIIKNDTNSASRTEIPEYLIKEEIDGKAFYYRGYKSVLNKEKQLEEIMGSSTLQAYLVELILYFLFQNLDRKQYRTFTNEIGGHIEKGSNLSYDIAVFEKTVLTKERINEFYADVPPKVVFEVDVKIDLDAESGIDYINAKTEKLLDFGVELIVWVFSKQEKLLVARPSTEWRMISWNTEIELIEGISLNLGALIQEDGELIN